MISFASFFGMPFHFWSAMIFIFGTMVGSLLNVCIYRMPRGESIVWPGSHCPSCGYTIPWCLNIPVASWLWLCGRCAHCLEAISPRYLLVELLTGGVFLACWLRFGADSPGLALVYCLLLAGFIAATAIDLEHLIIPDEITLGGIGAGFLCSLAVPGLHGTLERARALEQSFWGIVVGGGIIYGVLRLGKLMFGRLQMDLPGPSRIIFTESDLHLPDQVVPYEDIFCRKTDTIKLEASRVEMIDRCYWNVPVRLSPQSLRVGEENFDPEHVPYLEVETARITLPREAMGFGDVKFMAAIGAFLGWPAVIFTLMASSMIGSLVGISAILLRRREWSGRIPYGPYIALGAVLWVFLPGALKQGFLAHLLTIGEIASGRAFRTHLPI